MAATDQLQFFCVSKTQEISQKLFTFYNHIPHDIEMCRWFFKVLVKFEMATMGELNLFLLVQ